MTSRIARPSPRRLAARWRGPVLLGLALTAVSCGDGSSTPVQTRCAKVMVPHLALSTDPDCTVASHALTAEALPDLQFLSPFCFTTGFVPAQLTSSDGRSLAIQIAAFSGIVTNTVAGVGLQSPPSPLFDAQGRSHSYTAFLAASVVEVRSASGKPLGQLVTRDAGWAELDPATTLPSYVAERLVIAGGSGDGLAGTVGDVILNGDEFTGAAADGSICGSEVFDKLSRAAGR